tara:strand:- start:180 stop:617 length:438 start_codon:yes stop_codon:yes gene_type:complete
MKKLILVLTLSVLTFSCSDSDGVSINQDLVGNWTGFVGDDENPDDNEYIDITLNSDATGNITIEEYSITVGFTSEFNYLSWNATSSRLTINYLLETSAGLDEDGNPIYEYELDRSQTLDYELNSAGDVGVFTDDEGVMTTLYLQE